MYVIFPILLYSHVLFSYFFFFNDTATTEIYTLSLHDALPISFPFLETQRPVIEGRGQTETVFDQRLFARAVAFEQDRKSTRLNSSHSQISYAVFCLKKKKNQQRQKIYPINHLQPALMLSTVTP